MPKGHEVNQQQGKKIAVHIIRNDFCLNSLQCEDNSTNDDSTYDSTPGIDVVTEKIPKAGKFSIWDCAGQVEYHLTHGMFMGVDNSIFTVTYDIWQNTKLIWTSVSTIMLPKVIKGSLNRWLVPQIQYLFYKCIKIQVK